MGNSKQFRFAYSACMKLFILTWVMIAINIFGLIILDVDNLMNNKVFIPLVISGFAFWSLTLTFKVLKYGFFYWINWIFGLVWLTYSFWCLVYNSYHFIIMVIINCWFLIKMNQIQTMIRDDESPEPDKRWEGLEIWLSFPVIFMAVMSGGHQIFDIVWIRIALLMTLLPLTILSLMMEYSSMTKRYIKILLLEYVSFVLLFFYDNTISLVMVILLSRQSVRMIYLLSRIERLRVAVSQLFKFPSQLLTVSFLIIIIFGSVVLTFPICSSHAKGLTVIDAIFTATSATCVTGLVVLDTANDFTFFGQLTILVLIQLGGLGIMTISTFGILIIGNKLGLSHQWALSSILEERNPQSLYRLIKFIVTMTLLIEMIGAGILAIGTLSRNYSLQEAVWFGIFHSISAFCNAGFALHPTNLVIFSQTPSIIIPIAFLFIIGGIGFTVLFSIWEKITHPYLRYRLSLHVKVALIGTLVLLVLGSSLFMFLEWSGVLQNQSFSQKLVNSFFQSATPRTAGFNTIPIDELETGTQFMMMIFMFIGACPGSTAGGVKITTLIILILTVTSLIRGRGNVEFLKRRIPMATVFKATAIIMLSMLLISLTFFILLITQPIGFRELLFETVSAFGTVGLSCGITPQLTSFGKLIIIFLMFSGRLGPLTLALTLDMSEKRHYRLPFEDISVG